MTQNKQILSVLHLGARAFLAGVATINKERVVVLTFNKDEACRLKPEAAEHLKNYLRTYRRVFLTQLDKV